MSTHFGALLTCFAAAIESWYFSGRWAGRGWVPSSVSWRTMPVLFDVKI